MTNCTNEALLERSALAEKAVQGPWKISNSARVQLSRIIANREGYDVASCLGDYAKANAAHIVANSPDVVIADIDEILRLRAENKRLEKEADWLANALKQGCNGTRSCDCPAYMCDTFCPVIRSSCRQVLAKDWREVARKAIEENQ